MAAQAAGKKQRARQHRKKIEPGSLPVGHGESEGMPTNGVKERSRQRLHSAFTAREGLRAKVLHGVARFG